MVAQNIAFGIIAAVTVAAALGMVSTRNIVHAALFLVAVWGGLAANYVLLTAEFIATTQVLVYIGAVMVLFLFGIMLTRAPIGRIPQMTGGHLARGSVVGVGARRRHRLRAARPVRRRLAGRRQQRVPHRGRVRTRCSRSTSSPFEAVSVLLLAALIGAVVLARRD